MSEKNRQRGARRMVQDQMEKLIRSGVLLRFDRTLDEILQRIVDTAVYVIGTRYAALAVLDETGNIAKFVFSGMSKEAEELIGKLPKDRGFFGLLIEDGKPLRLKDVTKHPKFRGFPPHPIRSFLGVPIIVNGQPYGQLYLTEKIGSHAFTKRDEELAVLLVKQAVPAIERATLSEQANQTERLKLLNEIVGLLNRSPDERTVMDAALSGVQSALPFAEAAICLYHFPDEPFPVLCFPEGSKLGKSLRKPCLKVMRTPFSSCIHERKIVRVNELSLERAVTPFERWLIRRNFKSLMGVPIPLGEEVLGVLFVVSYYPDAFSDDDVTFLQAISEHVAVALRNVRLLQELQEKERVRGLLLSKVLTAQEEERRRISHELHDQTGQLLTAMLIQLQLLERSLSEPNHQERIAVLKQLADEIASRLHHIAWELRPPALDDLGLVAALERTVDEWSSRFNVSCEFQVNGLNGDYITPAIAIGIFRIVQEALTNIAKHAQATQAKVVVQQQNGQLTVIVEDNGIGFKPETVLQHPDQNRKLGLLGMIERAAMLGGEVAIHSKPGKGTCVIVRLPL